MINKYGIRYWFHDYGLKIKLHDAVLTRVWYVLQRAEIKFSTPRRINDQEQMPTLTQQQQVIVALQPVALFAALTEVQLEQIATGARLQRYTTGETLVREGEAGDSLFIIKRGRADVYVTNTDGRPVAVAQRSAGEYFGEMSLLTGAPRSASVVAALDTEVVIIDKHAFTTVLAADPSVLEALLDALDQRRSAVETRLAEENAKAGQTQEQTRATLLRRIGGFLGIKLAPA